MIKQRPTKPKKQKAIKRPLLSLAPKRRVSFSFDLGQGPREGLEDQVTGQRRALAPKRRSSFSFVLGKGPESSPKL